MDSYLALEKMLLILCADLAIIIGASRVFGWLFGKVGQPPVVGEILAGVILGPSLLGRLYPGAIQTMLTPKTAAVLSAMAQVGLVLLMLLIGLEFPFDRLRHAARASTLVAGAGILVPFAASYWLAGYLFRLAPGSSPELAFRLFFATAVSITAIPIMGRILIHTRPDAHPDGVDVHHGGGHRRRLGLDPARRGRLDGHARKGRPRGARRLARRCRAVGRGVLGAGPLRPRAPEDPADRVGRPAGGPPRDRPRRGLRRGHGHQRAGRLLDLRRVPLRHRGLLQPGPARRDPRLDRGPGLGAPPADLLRVLGPANGHGLARLGRAALDRAPPRHRRLVRLEVRRDGALRPARRGSRGRSRSRSGSS